MHTWSGVLLTVLAVAAPARSQPLLPHAPAPGGKLFLDANSPDRAHVLSSRVKEATVFDAVLTREGLELDLRLAWDWAAEKAVADRKKVPVRVRARSASAVLEIPQKKAAVALAECTATLDGVVIVGPLTGADEVFWFTELGDAKTEARLTLVLEYEALTPEAKVAWSIRRERLASAVGTELAALGKTVTRKQVQSLGRFVLEKNLVEVHVDGKPVGLADESHWSYRVALDRASRFILDEILEEAPRPPSPAAAAPSLFTWSSARLKAASKGTSEFTETRTWRVGATEHVVVPVKDLSLADRKGSFLDLRKAGGGKS